MPTYAYAYKQCGHLFEKRQSFIDAALTECPECGGPLHKVYDSVGVTFKRSGFYRADSRASGSSGSSGASSYGASSSGTSAASAGSSSD